MDLEKEPNRAINRINNNILIVLCFNKVIKNILYKQFIIIHLLFLLNYI